MTPFVRLKRSALSVAVEKPRSKGRELPVLSPTGRGEHPDYAARAARVDVEALASELKRRLRGEVRFDAGGRALYATDASNYRQTPIGVVLPLDEADLVEAVAVCRQFDAPIMARGGGTSIAGQTCNIAVVIDCSKYMRRVLAIDTARRL